MNNNNNGYDKKNVNNRESVEGTNYGDYESETMPSYNYGG
jgi:hypothetical protein